MTAIEERDKARVCWESAQKNKYKLQDEHILARVVWGKANDLFEWRITNTHNMKGERAFDILEAAYAVWWRAEDIYHKGCYAFEVEHLMWRRACYIFEKNKKGILTNESISRKARD